MIIDPKAKILLDADVIIHFIKGNQTGILHNIFPNALYLIDIVFNEVFKKSQNRTIIELMIQLGFIIELSFDNTSHEVKKEYFRLSRDRGKGESAVMAYCRYNNDVLASSNLKDIYQYCNEYKITYLTTMDFLAEAFRKQILSETECDEFIRCVKFEGSKLIKGIDRIRDYKTR